MGIVAIRERFFDRLDETAREVYEGTRPSRHFEERKGVGLCPISSYLTEKNPEVREIIFFPNIYYYSNKKARTGYGLFLILFLFASENALSNFPFGKKIIS